MTPAALETEIKSAIASTPFEPPMSVAFCKSVYDAVRSRVPQGSSIEVFVREGRELVVDVRGSSSCIVKIPLA